MTMPHRLRTSPHRTSALSYLLLAAATLACALPFSNKAFHIDDPLFIWTARQIVHHPFNPYGFHLVWYVTDMPMYAITKNPPLASYFGALLGVVGGWSERAWHLGFLLPTLAVVLGTFRLAQRFTASPLVAAAATLLAPGFMVSATGVMCDVLMLALWIWAILLWLRAIDSGRPLDFAASGMLIAACALTKYFGASLLLLLPSYALLRERRIRTWGWSLLIPVATLAIYQIWTQALYGRGLLWDAAQYARSPEHVHQASRLTSGLVGLSFLGGCALPVLFFSPFLWNRRQLILGALPGALAGVALWRHWMQPLIHRPEQPLEWIAVQFALYVAAGLGILALTIADYLQHAGKPGDADSILLALWVSGTFVFAAFLNWTVNARSLLPLIPAAAILLARRLDLDRSKDRRSCSQWPSEIRIRMLAVPLALSALISFVVCWGDTALANSARTMAKLIHGETKDQPNPVFFEGHWGFQYYMQLSGARPVEYDKFAFQTGDLAVIPENATSTFPIAPQLVASEEIVQIDPHALAATMGLGAGFYSSMWGPLPFSLGRTPAEPYLFVRLQTAGESKH
jgi:hypothetical protein